MLTDIYLTNRWVELEVELGGTWRVYEYGRDITDELTEWEYEEAHRQAEQVTWEVDDV